MEQLSLVPGADGFIQSAGGNAGYFPPESSVLTVSLPSAPNAGDLILVSVGWDSAINITSVQDSSGTQYVSALGPTLWAGVNDYVEQIFYGFAGSGTVTVSLSATPPTFFEVRLYEYAGIDPSNPVDATAAATGAGMRLDAGITTNHSNELIFAVAQQNGPSMANNPDAGPPLNPRPVVDGGGMTAADEWATDAGRYDLAFSLVASVPWCLQAIALQTTLPDAGSSGKGGTEQRTVGCDCGAASGAPMALLVLGACWLSVRARGRRDGDGEGPA